MLHFNYAEFELESQWVEQHYKTAQILNFICFLTLSHRNAHTNCCKNEAYLDKSSKIQFWKFKSHLSNKNYSFWKILEQHDWIFAIWNFQKLVYYLFTWRRDSIVKFGLAMDDCSKLWVCCAMETFGKVAGISTFATSSDIERFGSS